MRRQRCTKWVLHWPRWNRQCLAVDLIEELRPVIVDAVVLRCLPTGILRFEEFETTPDKGCPMNARAQQASHKERQGFWIVT